MDIELAIILDELGDIIRKNRNWLDIGGVKENTRAATIMKIIYTLAKEPLTKEGIHRAIGIHKGTVLTAALEVAIHKNLVFEHKPSIRYRSVDDPLKTKAYGYTYYLLNWSHSDAENLFAVYRDHRGYEKGGWSGHYYTEHMRSIEMGLHNERDRLSTSNGLESDVDYAERMRRLDNLDLGTLDRIGYDAASVIKKRYAERHNEFPDAKPGVIMRPIVLDTLIHMKIQGIIPNDIYPNGVLYTYVDVWGRLEKERLLDFLAKE